MIEALKLTSLAFFLVGFISTGFVIQRLPIPQRWQRWGIRKMMPFYGRGCLWSLGVTVNRVNIDTTPSPKVIVPNHLSYIDILILAACEPGIFVTSLDVGAVGFLGKMSRAGGCIFVDRQSRAHIKRELAEARGVLQQGHPLIIFAEGTSGDGRQVLPLKGALFKSAIMEQAPVVPVCINYQTVNGGTPIAEHRDSVFWYGDMEFFPHLKELLKLRKIRVDLHFLPPVESQSRNRKELTALVYNEICERYEPVVS